MADPPPEPIRYHLRTMKVLRPDRCGMPDGNRCSACTEDIALEQQFKELETSMEKIHIKRRALRTVMNQNHDRLIHRFPPEIASRIFFYYSLITLFLRAVCQKWRQLAWATPEVWPWIYINHKVIYWWNSNVAKLLVEWLERSAALPLTIRFVGPSDGDSAVYCVVTDLLNKHSARYDIQLDIPAHHFHRLSSKIFSINSLSPQHQFQYSAFDVQDGMQPDWTQAHRLELEIRRHTVE